MERVNGYRKHKPLGTLLAKQVWKELRTGAGRAKSSVQEDSYAQAKEVLKGKQMQDIEVNRRAREVEHELCEMRKQWVNMYDLITRLIEDTTIEFEEDTRIDYNKCINCENMDTDKNGIKCMILGKCVK